MGVAVTVGEDAAVGVKVIVGRTVSVGIAVLVFVCVGTGVSVGASSVAVMAGAVEVGCSWVEGAQAETNKKISKMIRYIFIAMLLIKDDATL